MPVRKRWVRKNLKWNPTRFISPTQIIHSARKKKHNIFVSVPQHRDGDYQNLYFSGGRKKNEWIEGGASEGSAKKCGWREKKKRQPQQRPANKLLRCPGRCWGSVAIKSIKVTKPCWTLQMHKSGNCRGRNRNELSSPPAFFCFLLLAFAATKYFLRDETLRQAKEKLLPQLLTSGWVAGGFFGSDDILLVIFPVFISAGGGLTL